MTPARWATGGIGAAILGGWTVTSILSLESGVPIAIASSTNSTHLFTRMQRANVAGADPLTDGDRESRIVNRWLNPAGYAEPPAFTPGTGPRTGRQGTRGTPPQLGLRGGQERAIERDPARRMSCGGMERHEHGKGHRSHSHDR